MNSLAPFILLAIMIAVSNNANAANGYRVHHNLPYTFSPEQACYDFANDSSDRTYISHTTVSCRVDHSDPNISPYNTSITTITNYTCPAGYETNSNNDCIIVGTTDEEVQPPLTDESIEQLSEIFIVSMLVLASMLGLLAGQQR